MNGRTMLFRIGAVTLAMAASGLIGEAVVRGARLSSATRFIAPHPVFGVYNIPNAAGWYVKEEVRQYVTINSRGLHDRDQWADGGGVLLLGDSFIAAFQVPLETSCQEEAERLLSDQCGRPVEVTAAACNGWGTANELAFLCREGFSYRPAAVVLALFPENDLLDNLGPSPRPVPWPPSVASPPPLLLPRFVSRAAGTALHRALSDRLPGVASVLTPGAQRAEQALVRGLLHLWQRQPTQIQERMWSRLAELLTAMRDSVHAHGASFGVMIVPGRLTLYPEEARRLIRQKRLLRMADLDPSLPRARLRVLLDSLAIPFCDPAQAFRDRFAAGVDPLFRREGHWNIEGNRLAAEALTSLIVRHGLLGSTEAMRDAHAHRAHGSFITPTAGEDGLAVLRGHSNASEEGS